MHVFHYLARDVYGAHILKKDAVLRALIHENFSWPNSCTEGDLNACELLVKL